MDAIPVTQVLSQSIVAHSKWTSGMADRGIVLKARGVRSERSFQPVEPIGFPVASQWVRYRRSVRQKAGLLASNMVPSWFPPDSRFVLPRSATRSGDLKMRFGMAPRTFRKKSVALSRDLASPQPPTTIRSGLTRRMIQNSLQPLQLIL